MSTLLLVPLAMMVSQPITLEPFANTDPAIAAEAWQLLEFQNEADFAAMLADDAELVLDRKLVENRASAYAATVAECDLASDFAWVSNVLGPTAPFEARLTCVGEDGYNKKVTFYFDNRDKIIAVEVNEPIGFKF